MATGTNLAFNHTARLIMNGTVDLVNSDLRVVACSATPVATNTVKGNLTVCSNLSAATIALTGESVATTATDDAKFDAGNVTFSATGAGTTIKAFAIYAEGVTGTLADALVCFGKSVATGTAGVTLAAGETLQFQWAAGGILQLVDTA